MKILLANPPWRRGKLYGIRAGSRWPFMTEVEAGNKIPGYMPFPFFLAYAAALLEKNGFTVSLIDALAEGLTDAQFEERVRAFAPDMYVAETSTPSIFTDLDWVKKVKGIAPSAKVVLCGSHVTVFPEQIMNDNPSVDFIAVSEYEFELLDLARSIEAKGKGCDIPGIYSRVDGKPVFGGPRKPVSDINVFPWPARRMLPMMAYNDTFAGMPSPNVTVWASRGCPFKCNFCNWPGTMYGGSSYRVRDVKDVLDEVEWLIKEYGFKAFYFDDDTFNIGKERILSICEGIKGRGICVPWGAMARADTSDRETLRAMKDAGLYAIKFGVESGVQEIVDRCGKGLNLEKVKEAVKNAKEAGIKVHLTFTFGLPGETRETVERTIRFAKEADPDSVQFSIVTPFPGTKYYDELKAAGDIEDGAWDKFDGNNASVVKYRNFREGELPALLAKATREWTMHQLRTRLLKHPLRTIVRGIRKPYYAAVFIGNLFKRK